MSPRVGLRRPPMTTVAPFSLASSTWRSITSSCCRQIIGPRSNSPSLPWRRARTFSTTRRVNSSATASTTYTRSVEQQNCPVFMKRAEDGAARRALQVGVGADDHRILAAELEGAGDEVPAAGLSHLAPGADAAGEGDLVDAGLDQRGARLAVALDHGEHALGQARLAEELGEQPAGEGRHLRRLHHHGVAGHHRLDAGVEREDEGAVPRGDHADDAERAVRDDEPLGAQEVERLLLVFEDPLGVLGVIGERVARGEDLHHDRLHPRAAGLADEDVDELLLPADEDLEGAAHHPGPLVEAGGGPGRLCGAGALDGGAHLGRAGHRDLTDVLSRHRARDPEATRASAALDRLDNGH